MTDPMLYSEWQNALIIAGIIVVAAVLLLITVWLSARRILKLAGTALGLVKQIKNNTRSIWELQTTNRAISDILEEAEHIEQHAGEVARALHDNEEAA